MTLFSNKEGFTVIEIMVAVAIISVLIAVVVSNFSSSRLQFSLPEVVYKFGQDVRRAQGLALAAAEYKDASGVSLPVDGYGVYVDLTSLGDKKYILYADKSPGNQRYDAGDYIIETVDLQNSGVVISNIEGTLDSKVSINMNAKNLATLLSDLLPNYNQVQVTFSLAFDPSKSKKVLINTSGLFETK